MNNFFLKGVFSYAWNLNSANADISLSKISIKDSKDILLMALYNDNLYLANENGN